MNTLILYAYNFRSRAERILWALEEFQLPYTLIRLDPFRGENSGPDFLKLNPLRKVPVLLDGEKVLTESLAIMEYLNDISTTIKLIPTQLDQHYRYRRAVYYCATEIEPYLWLADQNTRLKAYYHWPEGTADASIKRVSAALPIVFDWLMEFPHIAGEGFTLADIYYYQCLSWASHWGLEMPDPINVYLQKLTTRQAFPAQMLNAD